MHTTIMKQLEKYETKHGSTMQGIWILFATQVAYTLSMPEISLTDTIYYS